MNHSTIPICKGYRLSMGGGGVHERALYCSLYSTVCNANIPTLLLFGMAESACSPFCKVLRILLFIKFILAFYHVQYS